MRLPVVLALDVGTTALKAALVAQRTDAPVLVSVAVDLHAYRPSANVSRREQAPGPFLEALAAALNQLRDKTREVPCSLQAIALADQMHCVMTWRHDDPLATASPLVTWEDRRASQGWLRRLNAAVGGASPAYAGYGCVTLAHAAWEAVTADAALPLADCCGTVGAFLVYLLTGRGEPGAYLDATDAASWGFFDSNTGRFPAASIASAAAAVGPDTEGGQAEGGADAAAAVQAHLSRLLSSPIVVPSGTVTGRLAPASTTRAPILSSILEALNGLCDPGRDAPPPPVFVCIGDHPASVAGALASCGGVSPPSGGGLTMLVNVGTSAQVAVAIDGEGTGDGASKQQLPAGVEWRPGWGADAPPPLALPPCSQLLVGASLTGGNALAAIAEALLPLKPAHAAADDRFNWLEAAAGALLLLEGGHAAVIAAARAAVAVALLPERSLERAPTAGPVARPTGKLLVDLAAPVSAWAPALVAALGGPADRGSSERSHSPGLIYLAVADAVAHNLLHAMVPPFVAADVTRVAWTGRALQRSAVLRTCVTSELQALGSRRGAPPQIVELPEQVSAVAGVLGAAAVAWAAMPP